MALKLEHEEVFSSYRGNVLTVKFSFPEDKTIKSEIEVVDYLAPMAEEAIKECRQIWLGKQLDNNDLGARIDIKTTEIRNYIVSACCLVGKIKKVFDKAISEKHSVPLRAFLALIGCDSVIGVQYYKLPLKSENEEGVCEGKDRGEVSGRVHWRI